jgi:hypothetical protein
MLAATAIRPPDFQASISILPLSEIFRNTGMALLFAVFTGTQLQAFLLKNSLELRA